MLICYWLKQQEPTRLRSQLSAAPLKRIQIAAASTALKRTPRSIERGPVEAVRLVLLAILAWRLRAQLSAAPLKHWGADPAGAGGRGLRAQLSAAPLKRGSAADVRIARLDSALN